MQRRKLLQTGLIFGAASPGCAALQGLAKPKTEKKIGGRNLDSIMFDKIVFFESGAAEIWFEEDHSADRFGVTHEHHDIPEDAYETWATPEFSGPKVVDLKSTLSSHSPFPTNRFQIDVYNPDGFHFALNSRAEFSVPQEYITTTRTETPAV